MTKQFSTLSLAFPVLIALLLGACGPGEAEDTASERVAIAPSATTRPTIAPQQPTRITPNTTSVSQNAATPRTAPTIHQTVEPPVDTRAPAGSSESLTMTSTETMEPKEPASAKASSGIPPPNNSAEAAGVAAQLGTLSALPHETGRVRSMNIAPRFSIGGTDFTISLTGFEPNLAIPLHLYKYQEQCQNVPNDLGGTYDGECFQYIATLAALRTDANGDATYTLTTRPEDQPGEYMVYLELWLRVEFRLCAPPAPANYSDCNMTMAGERTETIEPLPTDTLELPTNTAEPLPTDTLELPTNTLEPLPTDTLEPLPTDTLELPTDTLEPLPTDTLELSTDTPEPLPTDTLEPLPTETPTLLTLPTETPLPPTDTPAPPPDLPTLLPPLIPEPLPIETPPPESE
jgi:hypothetical protein